MAKWCSALLYWSALITLLCYDVHAAGREFSFQLPAPAEAVAEITLQAPGASWGKSGAEAPLAKLSVDGAYNQDIVVVPRSSAVDLPGFSWQARGWEPSPDHRAE